MTIITNKRIIPSAMNKILFAIFLFLISLNTQCQSIFNTKNDYGQAFKDHPGEENLDKVVGWWKTIAYRYSNSSPLLVFRLNNRIIRYRLAEALIKSLSILLCTLCNVRLEQLL